MQMHPERRPVNISIDSDLLAEANTLGINISRACEQGLAEQVAVVRAARWRAENAGAIASSNAHAETQGLPLSRYRSF